jgi:hypothetical protein
MNIYEKIQQARVSLQEKNIKKSGLSKFKTKSGYEVTFNYFELSDFMPEVNRLFLEYKLCSQVSFAADFATLTITDAEKPEDKIVFTSPMSTADMGGHAIQSLGAVETYERRYLYMAAMELTESDMLDGTLDPDGAKDKPKPEPEPQNPAQQTNATVPQDNSSVAADAVTVKGAAAMIMPAGKVKPGKHDGETLGDIYKKDQSWAMWYMDKGFNTDIKTAFTTLHKAAQEALAKQNAAKAKPQEPQAQEGFTVQEEIPVYTLDDDKLPF